MGETKSLETDRILPLLLNINVTSTLSLSLQTIFHQELALDL